ncbi:hypothetical protein RHSIM_Rhsim13G0013900 [Rhododendron simsii]|uniref:Uncharacterized protein n=1 Tax=Rhododendron simsii TaxID=118357 RepID=A0A834G4L3_RHOSS|nr:hypothetical protein RHSIM_Rhsim13G0013900 [Rhododendron simsii]
MCFLLISHVNARVLCLQVDGGNPIDFYINVVALLAGLNSLLLPGFIVPALSVILLSWFCNIPLFNFLTKNGPSTMSYLDIAKPLFHGHMTHEMTDEL